MNVISMVILAIQAMQRSLLFAANFLWIRALMKSLDTGYRSFQYSTSYVSYVLSREWLDAAVW